LPVLRVHLIARAHARIARLRAALRALRCLSFAASSPRRRCVRARLRAISLAALSPIFSRHRCGVAALVRARHQNGGGGDRRKISK